jgi:hypothetical protein
MSTIERYADGSILDGIRKALLILGRKEHEGAEDAESIYVLEKIREFRPKVISIDEASACLRSAETIALGDRVCSELHPGSIVTRTVFLDELAKAMIDAGKAEMSNAEEAEKALRRYAGHPLIMSLISGRHLEICASHQSDCVFWMAEKHGMHCLERNRA